MSKPSTSSFPSSFPGQFRRHVQPQLAAAIPIEAWLIAADIQTWEDGYRHLIDLALSRGAGHLPDEVWYDLRDWLSGALLGAVLDAEPMIMEQRADLETTFRDIERFVRKSAGGTTNAV